VARIERELADVVEKRGGRRAPSAAAAGAPLTMAVEGDVWSSARGPRPAPARQPRLAMLARLVAEPGREFHVLDLGGGARRRGPASTPATRACAGRAGARRLPRSLPGSGEAIAEREADNDPARAEKARAEREALADELARGVGLGGRERRAGAAAERGARQRPAPPEGRARPHRRRRPRPRPPPVRSVRTGTFCCYEP
jgi:hypothetical protein